MTWLRIGDTFWADPRILQLASLPGADERTVNELAGFLVRLASYAAQYGTDYLIPERTALSLPGTAHPERLVKMLQVAGLCRELTVNEVRNLGLIDDPDLLHMISKEEKAWRNQRVADSRNPELMVPVRLRDGDQCRWCGHLVHWPGKPSNRKATLDHLHPGEAATVDTAIVACWSCNAARKDDPEWDGSRKPLREPETPLYGKVTVRYLARYGVVVTQNIGADRQLNMDSSSARGRKSGVAPQTYASQVQVDSATASGVDVPEFAASSTDTSEPEAVHAEDLGSLETTGDTEAFGVPEAGNSVYKTTLTNHVLSGRDGSESSRAESADGSVQVGSPAASGSRRRRKRKGRSCDG